MIGRFVRHPLAYLVLVAGLSFSIAESNGWLRPQITNDTQSYVHLLAATTLTEALSGLRSFGYPLVIKALDLSRDGWAHVPRFHFALYSLTVLLFWWAVSRFTRSPWLAFAAATPLFFVAAVSHIELVVTDSIGESLGLITVALLLLVVTTRRRAATAAVAALLALAVFMAYFTRPNYQFLVVLIPLLGWVLRLCHQPRRRPSVRAWTLGLLALTLVPWLGFCALRAATVGHFGVSTFSGYHLGSIGAMMLDDELVVELPPAIRPLGRQILDERRRRGWQPMRLRSNFAFYQNRHFGQTMFEVVEPVATRFVVAEEGRTLAADGSTDLGPRDIPGMIGPTALAVDLRLVDLGKAAIRARPLVYLKWVVAAVRLGLAKVAMEPLVPALTGLLAFSLLPLLVRASRDPALLGRPWAERSLGVFGLFLVAGIYFLGHTTIIALIHWPKDRYAVAASLLLPSALAAGLFELWRWILPLRGRQARRPGRSRAVAGAVWAAILCLLLAEVLFRVVGFDFDRQRRETSRIPVFHRLPTVPTGAVFFRRPGPQVWRGRVLAEGGEIEARYDGSGFRNPPELADWEVVVAGDGFVEAGYLPREKIFTEVLAAELGVPVKNLGLNHTGTLAQIHFLRSWGRSDGARHAVLAFNEGDDLADLRRESSALYWSQRGRPRPTRVIVPQASLTRAVLSRLGGGGAAGRPAPPPAANAVLTLPGREPVRVRVFQRVPGPRSMPAQTGEQLDDVVGRWAAACRDLELRPWLLYLPAKHRVLKPYLLYDEEVEARVREWKPTALPALVERLAAAHGVDFVDAGPRLARATARGELVYNRIDVHLSADGSRHLGRLLAGRLAAADGGG